MAAFDVEGGEPLAVSGLSMGGGWRLVPRPDGAGMALLGAGVLSGSESTGPPHRVALAVFRLGADGFVPEPAWNGGAPRLTAPALRWSEFDPAPLLAAEWGR